MSASSSNQSASAANQVATQGAAQASAMTSTNLDQTSVKAVDGQTSRASFEALVASEVASFKECLTINASELSTAGQKVDEAYEEAQHALDMLKAHDFTTDPRSATVLKAERTEIKAFICEHDAILFKRGVMVEDFGTWLNDIVNDPVNEAFPAVVFQAATQAEQGASEDYHGRYGDRASNTVWNKFMTIE